MAKEAKEYTIAPPDVFERIAGLLQRHERLLAQHGQEIENLQQETFVLGRAALVQARQAGSTEKVITEQQKTIESLTLALRQISSAGQRDSGSQEERERIEHELACRHHALEEEEKQKRREGEAAQKADERALTCESSSEGVTKRTRLILFGRRR